ncbi:MAG: hypothetical protein ACXVPQ_02785 [Bacteroidia bacterium]
MKKTILCTILFSLFLCFAGMAQDPGPLASNSSFSGRRELRKEMRIKKNERRNLRKQERSAIKKRRKQYGTRFGREKKKKVKVTAPAPASTEPKVEKPKG